MWKLKAGAQCSSKFLSHISPQRDSLQHLTGPRNRMLPERLLVGNVAWKSIIHFGSQAFLAPLPFALNRHIWFISASSSGQLDSSYRSKYSLIRLNQQADLQNPHIRLISASASVKPDSNYRPKYSLSKSNQQLDVQHRAKRRPIVYDGSYSNTLRKMKLICITTCYITVITGPILTFFSSPQLSVLLKGGVAGAATLLSASLTVAVHWFFGPYVHKLTWKPGEPQIELEVLSWLGAPVSKTIQVSDIRPPKTTRPFVSFAALNELYYVDPNRISDKELLRMLTFYRKLS